MKNFYFFIRYFFLKSIVFLYKRRRAGFQGNKRIFVVKPDLIGDLILYSSFIKQIKLTYPHHQLVFVGNSVVEDLVPFIEGIDESFLINIKSFQRNPFYFIKIVNTLIKMNGDILLCPVFSRSFTFDEISSLIASPHKISFIGECSRMSLFWKKKGGWFVLFFKISIYMGVGDMEEGLEFI